MDENFKLSFDQSNLSMVEQIKEFIKPEYAILISPHAATDRILIMDNFDKDKFFCRKLLIVAEKYRSTIEENIPELQIYAI